MRGGAFFMIILPLLFLSSSAKAQFSVNPAPVIFSNQDISLPNIFRQLDSIAASKNTASHFASLYKSSMSNLEHDSESLDSSAQHFIRQFELQFAEYFLNACIEEKDGMLHPASAWKTYFSNSEAEGWQLALIGVNAHVNIDLHRALTDRFSLEEIKAHRKNFLVLHSAILKEFNPIFKSALSSSSYLRFVNTVSRGLGKKFGEQTLYRWRKRQVRLAILFYQNPRKYQKKFNGVIGKKARIDNMILRVTRNKQAVILPKEPFHELDSIGKSNSHSKYFGELYHRFLTGIEEQLSTRDTTAKKLVRRFENVFADYYINACKSYLNKEKIDLQEWQTYFSDSTLKPIQYLLLGANAHLNGGLWNALVNSFTAEEMKQLQPEFHIFKKTLNKTYHVVYQEGTEHPKLNKISKAVLGMDKLLGNFYLYKWRKRQMRIARLYWSQSPKHAKLVARVEKKKNRIDPLILNLL